MTPAESKLLQRVGLAYVREVEELSISIFFYGASSSLAVLLMRLIHKFENRIVRLTLLCVGRYFCVRFLILWIPLFFNKT